MEDVTGLLNQYREAARIIWNNFLRDEEAYYDVTNELTCDFNAIKRLLFIAIVLRRFGVEENHLPPEFTGEERLCFSWVNPITFLRVVPVLANSPVMINRDAGAHAGYWDAPVNRIGPDADLVWLILSLKAYAALCRSPLLHVTTSIELTLSKVTHDDTPLYLDINREIFTKAQRTTEGSSLTLVKRVYDDVRFIQNTTGCDVVERQGALDDGKVVSDREQACAFACGAGGIVDSSEEPPGPATPRGVEYHGVEVEALVVQIGQGVVKVLVTVDVDRARSNHDDAA